MNNVMDETAQEIADLKADLLDAQKETARLEQELQEAYAEKPAVAPKPNLADKKIIDQLELQIQQADDRNRRMETQVQEAKASRDMLRADLVMALSLIEVIRLNKHDGFAYFTTPQGRERLKWAADRYTQEMSTFTNALSKEK